MGTAIAAFPWDKTPLGALEHWATHLRVAVNLILDAGAPMALIWGTDYRFLYNDRYAQVIQDKHPSALGAAAPEIFPEIWPIVQPFFQQALSGEAVLIEDHELQLTRRGKTKPAFFSFSYNPVRDDQGRVDGFLAVVVETTARVELEQERAKSFDTVLSAITDFAYTFDLEGRFLFVNRALLDLLGLRHEQAVGKNFFELNYPPELAARLQNQIQEVIQTKKSLRDETRFAGANGVEGFYEYIFSPVFGPDGGVTLVAGSTRDITDRKNWEIAAVTASRAKDDFLATLSHELRTPLNPVLLIATDSANNPELAEEVRADFRTIVENVTLEARLIDDLLDISRIAHDKFPLELKTLEINSVLQRAVLSVQTELKAKQIALTQKRSAAGAVVTGDELRLHQLFGNLLRNAVKFTPRGGRITIATQIDSADPGRVCVEITDTGIGLSSAELNRVFEPFSQGEHAKEGQKQFGGLGLGLAISRKVAELHGGRLSGRSAGAGLGATFVVTLPLSLVNASTAEAGLIIPKSTEQAVDQSHAWILLVEDHVPSRQALARLLASRKINVREASSAADALDRAAEQRFDLVISDIGLPGMDGYELMQLLKTQYGYRGIALSGYGTEEDLALSKKAGFELHLTKPVQAQALYYALNQFLE